MKLSLQSLDILKVYDLLLLNSSTILLSQNFHNCVFLIFFVLTDAGFINS